MEVFEFGLKHLNSFGLDLPTTKVGVEDRLASLRLLYPHGTDKQKEQMKAIINDVRIYYRENATDVINCSNKGRPYQD